MVVLSMRYFGPRFDMTYLPLLSIFLCFCLGGVTASARTEGWWTRATAQAEWAGRWKHTSVSYDGKLWVIGGNENLSDVWFSPDGENWTLVTNNPGWAGREDHSTIVYDGKLWVLGGWFDLISTFGRFNDAWFSTDGSNWSQATSEAGWDPRYGHTSVVHDGKMWVLGGWRGDIFLNDVWWSTDGVEWNAATLEAGWPARGDMTSVSYEGKIWILGGNGGNLSHDLLIPYADVWCSEDGVTWTEVTDSAPWGGTRFHTSVVYDDRIWLLGGGFPHFFGPVAEMTNEVWWTTDGLNWTHETDSAEWLPRGEHTSVVHDGKMWVLGGWNKDEGRLNDVWYFPSAAFPTRSDINEDGLVDSNDLLILLKDWGKVSGP